MIYDAMATQMLRRMAHPKSSLSVWKSDMNLVKKFSSAKKDLLNFDIEVKMLISFS